MIIKGKKSIEELVKERFENGDDLLALVVPQLIVPQENGSKYFYTTTGMELTRHSVGEMNLEHYIKMIYSIAHQVVVKLNREINDNKMIVVENNKGKDYKLIKRDNISEVQLIVS